MAERLRIQHYHSLSGATPVPSAITLGEIAVGAKADEEKLFIKNTRDEIISFEPFSEDKLSSMAMTTEDIDLIWDSYFSSGYGSGSASATAEDDVINSVGVGDYDE